MNNKTIQLPTVKPNWEKKLNIVVQERPDSRGKLMLTDMD